MMHKFVRIALIVSLTSLAACADDASNNETSGMDMGTSEADMGTETQEDTGGTDTQDMSANNSSLPDMDFGPCEPTQFLNTVDDSCVTCPGAELTCEDALANMTLDEVNNIVTVTFDPSTIEIAEATWSGNRTEGDGMSDITVPFSIDGSVQDDTLRFNLSNEDTADELQLGRLRIVDGCEQTVAFSLIARWEPGLTVITEPMCL